MDQEIRDKYEVVIGLEVHAQLLTNSKIYNSDSANYGSKPNTNISSITLAHPGTLPKLNKKVVEYAIKMGLACGCEIARKQIFDRKNYFYPDLPKGYQITQDRTPICRGGSIHVKPKVGEERDILLTKIHIEEDAGKSIHLDGEDDTLVDFNRAGVPLIEIVTEPHIHNSYEAYSFLTEVRKLVRYLDICDGNMEEGSLRCDANISVMPKGSSKFGPKVEIKNMNSIKNVQQAIDYEIIRQITLNEKGETVNSETRTFDANSGTTASMRAKEELNDYRYFPDPDLSPLNVSEEWINELKAQISSLPNELFDKFRSVFGLSEYDAEILTENKDIALYFEELCTKTSDYKAASNWIMGPVKSQLNELSIPMDKFPLKTDKLSEVIKLVNDDKLSFSVASQKLLPAMMGQPEKEALSLAIELNLIQDSNRGNLEAIIADVLEQFPDKVKAYKKGKKGLIGMFVGEVMKLSEDKADPKLTNKILREKLDN